ncbi:MAG: hypothetical protein KGL39_15760 [Patescibacteria group bacterium]|nr:hypothetical protein [Patescibacteria group bacterium]
MNLKNYTTSVPVETTISRIEQFLIGTGLVSGIGKQYANGVTTSIVFEIKYKEDKLPLTVRLAARVAECQEFFWRDHCATARRSRKTKEDFLDQAARTAWRLQEDDVRVQTSLILLKQRTVVEAFMASIWDGERTYYQRVADAGFKQLAAPKE